MKPSQVIGVSGSSKRWSESPTKQPLANIVWSPILDRLERREHRVAVEEAARADLDPRLGREGQPATWLEQRPFADSQAPFVERLEDLPLEPAKGRCSRSQVAG